MEMERDAILTERQALESAKDTSLSGSVDEFDAAADALDAANAKHRRRLEYIAGHPSLNENRATITHPRVRVLRQTHARLELRLNNLPTGPARHGFASVDVGADLRELASDQIDGVASERQAQVAGARIHRVRDSLGSLRRIAGLGAVGLGYEGAAYCPPFPGLFLYYPRRKNLAPKLQALVEFLRPAPRRPRRSNVAPTDRHGAR